MSKWRLFLDDERYPAQLEDWKIARNVDDAMWYVKNYGIPYHIAFDHDLGHCKLDGYDFASVFISYILENEYENELSNFSYSVHSQNPIGRSRIINLMQDILEISPEGSVGLG
jgi:hypothetical protein